MKGTILYVGNFKLPDKNAAAQRVLANSKIFVKLGYEVILVGVADEVDTGIYEHASELKSIQMYSVPYPKNIIEWIKFYGFNGDINTIIKSCQNLKYFIGYNYQSLSFLKLLLKFGRRTKFLADVTEWYQPDDNSWLLRTIKKIDCSFRMRVINNYLTDGNIVISSFLENYYKNQKSLKLPPLVDLEDNKWKFQLLEKSKPIRFIFFGTLGGKKEEIGLVLKFFNYISNNNKNYELNIYGIEKQELEKLDVPVNPNVRAHGRVSHEEALQEVSKANFSIFFREKNLVTTAGFPTKFVETMSAGTPVITNYSSDLKEYLVHGVNSYVINIVKLKKEEFSDFEALDFSSDKINSMKKSAYRTSEQNFHLMNYICKTDDFLKSILDLKI